MSHPTSRCFWDIEIQKKQLRKPNNDALQEIPEQKSPATFAALFDPPKMDPI